MHLLTHTVLGTLWTPLNPWFSPPQLTSLTVSQIPSMRREASHPYETIPLTDRGIMTYPRLRHPSGLRDPYKGCFGSKGTGRKGCRSLLLFQSLSQGHERTQIGSNLLLVSRHWVKTTSQNKSHEVCSGGILLFVVVWSLIQDYNLSFSYCGGRFLWTFSTFSTVTRVYTSVVTFLCFWHFGTPLYCSGFLLLFRYRYQGLLTSGYFTNWFLRFIKRISSTP